MCLTTSTLSAASVSVNNLSDTHLTPDAHHIKEPQTTLRVSRKASLLKVKTHAHTHTLKKATDLEIEAAAGKTFLF